MRARVTRARGFAKPFLCGLFLGLSHLCEKISHVLIVFSESFPKNSNVFQKISNVFQRISNVFQKISNVFQRISDVFQKTPTFFRESPTYNSNPTTSVRSLTTFGQQLVLCFPENQVYKRQNTTKKYFLSRYSSLLLVNTKESAKLHP